MRLGAVFSRRGRAVDLERALPALVVVHDNENLEDKLVEPAALWHGFIEEPQRDSYNTNDIWGRHLGIRHE